jgi:hypothetical protein
VLELKTFYEWEKIKIALLVSEPIRTSLPVPFQGRRHGNGLVGFKKPQTIQERRHHEALQTDVIDESGRRLFVRAKRLNLPNGWEDRNRTVQRSWKEHRQTQYK